jgi:hypothetical protein
MPPIELVHCPDRNGGLCDRFDAISFFGPSCFLQLIRESVARADEIRQRKLEQRIEIVVEFTRHVSDISRQWSADFADYAETVSISVR